MKSLIKLMLLMGLTASVNVYAMSKLSKKESLAEDKEKSECKIKTLEFPKGVRKIVTLSINEKESLTGKTFAELIENKARKNESFILARVQTKIGNDFVIHYFDAHALNKRLFGDYPIINMPAELIDPLNSRQIKIIDYFIIKKNEHKQELNQYLPEVLSNIVLDYQECFEYLCSSADLVADGQEDLLDYFYLNSDNLNLNMVNRLMTQADKYYFDLKDYQRAKEYWEKVATPEVKNVNLAVWAIANTNLGEIYYYGRLGAPDYQKAKEYYEKIATPEVKNVNLAVWAIANKNLGNIYYDGSLGAPDYQKAKEYWEKVATPEVKNANLTSWAIANTNLGEIYYYGKLGAPDYQTAKEFWEKAAIPEVKNVSLAVWANANNSLGAIYYYGYLGARDYKKAKEYYEKIATAEAKNVDLALWANANNNLGNIYYHGKLGAPDYEKAKEYYEKIATAEVKNVNLDLWKHANEKLEELEKIEKEKSAKSELVN